MSRALATRCAACGTAFKVSEAQLVASEGLVRCGRCDTVFNAREALFDAETGEPLGAEPDAPAPAAAPEPAVLPPVAEPPASASLVEPGWPADSDEGTGAGRTEPHWAAEGDAPLMGAEPSRTEPQFAAETPPALAQARMRELLGVAPSAEVQPDGLADAPAFASVSAAPPASGASSKGGPRRRLAALALGLLALALPLHWAWSERAALLAKQPALQGMWRSVCGCEPPAWRHLEGLSVSASQLQPTPRDGALMLRVTIENRAAHALALPSLDLRLLDGQGRTSLRRALSPQELGATLDRLPPGERQVLQGVFRLDAGVGAPHGYEIVLFHP